MELTLQFLQLFNSEYDAFKAYAETHKNCVFLVDTFTWYLLVVFQ